MGSAGFNQPVDNTGNRILIVEDNAINQRVVTSILQKNNLQSDLVCNGAEALAAITEKQYDLILMDCQMPVLDGYEATRQIRIFEKQTGNRRTPVIALTAHAIKGDREKCLAAGMDDYLSKPFTPADLVSIVDKWLRKSPSYPDQ
ncbi:response regulator [bacterium]|nr:response regulator [candidate division CSSED10-310 bacterium]